MSCRYTPDFGIFTAFDIFDVICVCAFNFLYINMLHILFVLVWWISSVFNDEI